METSIRIARKAAGLTQQQLADRYGIPIRTVVDWDRGVRTPPEYVKNMLLRCLAIDFPIKCGVLSEREPQKPLPEPVPAKKKPDYTLHTSWGKRLTPTEASYVEQERACGRVSLVSEADDGSGRKQYVCTENGFMYEMRPVKE